MSYYVHVDDIQVLKGSWNDPNEFVYVNPITKDRVVVRMAGVSMGEYCGDWDEFPYRIFCEDGRHVDGYGEDCHALRMGYIRFDGGKDVVKGIVDPTFGVFD